MWIDFLLSVVLLACALYLPAFLIIRTFSRSWLKSLVCAPLITIAVYSLLAVLYQKIGVGSNFFDLVLPLFAVEIVVYLVGGALRNRKKKGSFVLSGSDTKSDWAIWGCYAGFAAIVTFVCYVGLLDGPASFLQDSDNTWHLSLIQSFVQSGNFSTLSTGLYHDLEELSITPIIDTSNVLYPAAWHLLAALCTQLLGVPVSLAANAVNTVFLVLVLPSSLWMFFTVIFRKNKELILIGSLLSLAFAAYPWGMLIFGPLYPNFAAYALVPLECALFISLFDRDERTGKVLKIALLVIGLVSMACLHMNAVFTTGALVVPFCVYAIVSWIGRTTLDKKRKIIFGAILTVLFLAFVCFVWYALFSAPFMRGTVSFKWEPYASIQQEVVNILCLAYKMPGVQIPLGIAVFIGGIYTLFRRKYLWITVSYMIACFFCIVSAASNNFLKSLLTGFWYTDVYRLSGIAVLAAIPLAALGLYVVLRAIRKLVEQYASSKDKKSFTYIATTVFLACFVVCNFYPSFTIPGSTYVTTGFGDYMGRSHYANSYNRPNLYDEDEKAFISKVEEVVDPSYAIYNNADDGSAFAYAFNDLNLVYRRNYSGGETQQGVLLRKSLDELYFNEEVQDILLDANVRYILVLDQGGEATAERCWYGYYSPSFWEGINSIDDSTPGLNILLSEGDMRLYEIDYDAIGQ